MMKLRPSMPLALRRPTVCITFTMLVMTAGTSFADEFCAELNKVVTHAQANFLDETGALASAANLPTLPEAGNCALSSTLSGRNAYHCSWRYEYRADAAKTAFDAFNNSLTKCYGDLPQSEQGLGVNHPDSYDLREYHLDQTDISLSIKDKGALQATYVFVRVAGPAPD